MDGWTEFRTAMMVAKHGTISAAAEALGVHRATVARHVDTLEERLGTPLFLRHAKGYALTDTGQSMLETTGRIEDMLTSFKGRIAGEKERITGELVITSVSTLAPLIMPAIADYRQQFPASVVRFKASPELAELGYGEAHVAVRAGEKPQNPDYVVLPYQPIKLALYGHRNLIEERGITAENWRDHPLVVVDSFPRSSLISDWFDTNVDCSKVVFTSNDPQVNLQAIYNGVGLGWVSTFEAEQWPELVQITEPMSFFRGPLWFVSHIDMHRTAKVQAFKSILLSR